MNQVSTLGRVVLSVVLHRVFPYCVVLFSFGLHLAFLFHGTSAMAQGVSASPGPSERGGPGAEIASFRSDSASPSDGASSPSGERSVAPVELSPFNPSSVNPGAVDLGPGQDSSRDSQGMALSLIPASPNSGAGGLVIQGANSSSFRSLIVPEWYPLVRDGRFQLTAFRTLSGPSTPDEAWVAASAPRASRVTELGLTPLEALTDPRGFPYGLFTDFSKREDDVRAAAVLNNSAAYASMYPYTEGRFRISVVRQERIERQIDGTFARLAMGRLEVGKTAAQAWRELTAFVSPEALQGYRFLTFRFAGPEDDLLWMFSPLLSESRQLTGANRNDALFGSLLSLNDLALWSEKPELVTVRQVEETTRLVSFIEGSDQVLRKNERGCWESGTGNGDGFREPMEEGRAGATDGSGSDGLTSGVGEENGTWLPERAVFVPRSLLRVEIYPRDPFALSGRQVLYFDTLLQLPVARVVYDRGGELSKLYWGTLSVAASEDSARREADLRHLWILDSAREAVASVHFTRSERCDVVPSGVRREVFDPAHLQSSAGGTGQATDTAKIRG